MENRQVRPWDLFNKNKERAGKELKDIRMQICKECPFFIKATAQCTKCGCFMHLKTQLAEASCPLHKWESIDTRLVSFKDEEQNNN